MSIETARKLKALAERGYKAEKTTARKILMKYLEKHDLTLEMLDDTRLTERAFKYRNGEEKLMIQIVSMACEGRQVYGTVGRSNRIIVDCTDFEAIEIRSMYEYYSRLYNEELEVFMTAFIHKNNLYGQGGKSRMPTPEEREKAFRALQMSEGIKQGNYFKQINSHESDN